MIETLEPAQTQGRLMVIVAAQGNALAGPDGAAYRTERSTPLLG